MKSQSQKTTNLRSTEKVVGVNAHADTSIAQLALCEHIVGRRHRHNRHRIITQLAVIPLEKLQENGGDGVQHTREQVVTKRQNDQSNREITWKASIHTFTTITHKHKQNAT